jgi:hypothetical protein
MVDFGPEQGLSVFCSRRHIVTIPRIAEKRKRCSGPKDAIAGWTLTNTSRRRVAEEADTQFPKLDSSVLKKRLLIF